MPELSPDQEVAKAAIHAFLGSGETLLALSGPAGTGKSTLVGQFLRETGSKVHLTATTHKAARVAADLAGGEAVTVHSLFGLRPVNDYATGETRLERSREPKAATGSLVVVDEASMVDRVLLDRLAQDAQELGLQILFVGDPYQLPPVADADGPPAVFDRVRTLKLATVHRQAAGNPIIALATALRGVLDGGPYPVIRPRGQAIQRLDRRAFGGRVRELFTGAEYAQDPNHCRLVAWTNARVQDLNRYVRGLLLGADAQRYPYLPGETLIVNEAVTNDDRVLLANEAPVVVQKATAGRFGEGEADLPGYWLEVADAQGDTHALFMPDDRGAAHRLLGDLRRQAQTLKATLAGDDHDAPVRAAWRRYFLAKESFTDLRPPHAVTTHKSQGSSYRHVLIQLEDIARAAPQPGDLLARLLYVTVTRAAETASCYGTLPGHLYGPTRSI